MLYISIYVYMYIHIHLVRHGNRQDVFYGFRRRHHPTFFMASVIGVFMFSVVAGSVFHSFRPWFFMISVVAGKRCFMVSVAGFSMDSAVA